MRKQVAAPVVATATLCAVALAGCMQPEVAFDVWNQTPDEVEVLFVLVAPGGLEVINRTITAAPRTHTPVIEGINLDPGTYTVHIEALGFRLTEQVEITDSVSSVDAVLSRGGLAVERAVR